MVGVFAPKTYAQAEANVWGGLRGIRVDGELMTVTSGLRALNSDTTLANPGGRERLGNPQFSREGNRQISTGGLVAGVDPNPGGAPGGRGRRVPARVNGQVTYEDAGPGLVKVDVLVTATADTPLAGVYYYLHLPGEDYADGSAQLIESVRGRGGGLRLARAPAEINIAAVVKRTEPHLNLVECFDRKTNTCPIDPVCGLKGALLNAQAAFFAELERYTLADFAPRAPALIKLWRRQAAETGGG